MADIIGVDKIGNQQVGTGKNLQSQPAGNREAPPPLPPMQFPFPGTAPPGGAAPGGAAPPAPGTTLPGAR